MDRTAATRRIGAWGLASLAAVTTAAVVATSPDSQPVALMTAFGAGIAAAVEPDEWARLGSAVGIGTLLLAVGFAAFGGAGVSAPTFAEALVAVAPALCAAATVRALAGRA